MTQQFSQEIWDREKELQTVENWLENGEQEILLVKGGCWIGKKTFVDQLERYLDIKLSFVVDINFAECDVEPMHFWRDLSNNILREVNHSKIQDAAMRFQKESHSLGGWNGQCQEKIKNEISFLLNDLDACGKSLYLIIRLPLSIRDVTQCNSLKEAVSILWNSLQSYRGRKICPFFLLLAVEENLNIEAALQGITPPLMIPCNFLPKLQSEDHQGRVFFSVINHYIVQQQFVMATGFHDWSLLDNYIKSIKSQPTSLERIRICKFLEVAPSRELHDKESFWLYMNELMGDTFRGIISKPSLPTTREDLIDLFWKVLKAIKSRGVQPVFVFNLCRIEFPTAFEEYLRDFINVTGKDTNRIIKAIILVGIATEFENQIPFVRVPEDGMDYKKVSHYGNILQYVTRIAQNLNLYPLRTNMFSPYLQFTLHRCIGSEERSKKLFNDMKHLVGEHPRLIKKAIDFLDNNAVVDIPGLQKDVISEYENLLQNYALLTDQNVDTVKRHLMKSDNPKALEDKMLYDFLLRSGIIIKENEQTEGFTSPFKEFWDMGAKVSEPLGKQPDDDTPLPKATSPGGKVSLNGELQEPIVIVHVSDLHIGYGKLPQRAVTRNHDNNRLETARLAIINKINPDILIVSGDISTYGDIQSLEKASSIFYAPPEQNGFGMGREGKYLFLVPGNHDFYEEKYRLFPKKTFLRRTLNYEKVFKDSSAFKDTIQIKEISLNGINLLLFGFNSVSENLADVARGEIGKEQLNWFRREVQKYNTIKYNSAYKIAVLHHHIIKHDRLSGENLQLLKDRETFIPNIQDAGVQIVLHGHRHCGCHKFEGYIDRFASKPLIVVAAGTLCQADAEYGQTTSFNVLRLYNNSRISLQRWDYQRGRENFEAFSEPIPLNV